MRAARTVRGRGLASALSVPRPRARAGTPWPAAAEARREHGPRLASAPRPRGRKADRGNRNHQFPFAGRQHRIPIEPSRRCPRLGRGLKRTAFRQFGARARSLPAHAVQSPLTRPAVHYAPTVPNEPHPRGSRRRVYGNVKQGRASTVGREEQLLVFFLFFFFFFKKPPSPECRRNVAGASSTATITGRQRPSQPKASQPTHCQAWHPGNEALASPLKRS